MRRLFLLALLITLAGCNLAANTAGTPTSFGPLPTTSYVAPTPYIAPTLINGVPVVPLVVTAVPQAGAAAQGVILVTVTPVPGQVVIITTPVPGQIVVQPSAPSQTSQNIIEALVNNLIVPAWNLLYTFFMDGISTLWLFAGARGGGFAQVFCCIGPIVVVVVALVVRFRPLRWRRR